MKRYNPSEIEPKWQQAWDEQQTYQADFDSEKPKYFAMSMFNYPSGAGIHIGHAMNYTISDVMARYKRQAGYESYHPVGWDSFGLPAENFAIKTGISPQASMAKIIPSYHSQYKAMGWSNDWSREIATSDPRYYKWTQWIFEQVYKAGLAYQDARQQWWCTKCQTVLSNEQVIDGKCWRHDSIDDPLVEKKEVKQWFFKITEYADEMLKATDDLNWTESVKLAQKNWIGKSQGAEVTFNVDGSEDLISVFTTRPDTLFGATFLVLAPEHELAHTLANENTHDSVDEYITNALKKTELERQSEGKEKTGVFTGSHAINPANGEKVPIWIADYVLGGYGTGAVMAVPAHDERDLAFAEKFDLPVVKVVESDSTEGVLINSGQFDGMQTSDAREHVVAWLEQQGVGNAKTTFKIRDWSVSRQRYWGAPIPIIHCKNCGPQLVPEEQLPVVLPELTDFAPSGDGRSALARANDWVNVSCPNCDGAAERETDTLDTYICSSWYFLRYIDSENTNFAFDRTVADKWMPVDFYNGADHATAHMIYARFITRFLADKGYLSNPEPFKKFLFNGKVTAQNGEMFSKSKGNGVDPLEIINQGYGADALRTYLMFAAPVDTWVKWDPQGVPATHRFLNRIWNLTQEFLESHTDDGATNDNVERIIHPLVKKVTHDLEHQKYNTAIAAMMEATNKLYALKVTSFEGTQSWKNALVKLAALVAPFAPHVADELWQELGQNSSVQKDSWPSWDNVYTTSDTITIVVQVNGKVRAKLSVASDISKEDAIQQALAEENVQRFITSEPKKTVYVAGKLVSIVA